MRRKLRHQLRLLTQSQILVMIALEMSNPFLPIYLKTLQGYHPATASLWNALVYILPVLAAFISAPIWGHFSDRFGTKPMLMRATISLTVIQFLLFFVSNIYLFAFMRMTQGALAGFLAASKTHAVYLTPRRKRRHVLGLLQVATAIGIAVGPLIGGLLATFMDYHYLFLMAALLNGLVTLGFWWGLSAPRPESKKVFPTRAPTVTLNLPKKRYYGIGFLLLVILLTQMVKFLPQSFFALYALDFTDQTFLIGLLYATPGIGMVLSFKHLSFFQDLQRHISAHIWFTALFLIGALAYWVQASSADITFIIASRLIFGIALGGIMPMLLSQLCAGPQGRLGRLIGYSSSAIKLGNLIGIGLGGLLFQLQGAAFGFALGGWLMFTLSLCFCILSTADFFHSPSKQQDDRHQ